MAEVKPQPTAARAPALRKVRRVVFMVRLHFLNMATSCTREKLSHRPLFGTSGFFEPRRDIFTYCTAIFAPALARSRCRGLLTGTGVIPVRTREAARLRWPALETQTPAYLKWVVDHIGRALCEQQIFAEHTPCDRNGSTSCGVAGGDVKGTVAYIDAFLW